MIKLKFPPIVGQEKEIYIKCANAFTNKKDYAKKALAYVDEVEKYSSAYEKYVPRSIACFTHIKLDKDKKEIINKIYEQKFAKEKSVGRKYYDIIMANANGRCPICGGGKLKNLDHFLPKSKYPLLCVTPLNLIPTCRDCNMEKRAVISNNYYEIPFHPYLEDMVDQ